MEQQLMSQREVSWAVRRYLISLEPLRRGFPSVGALEKKLAATTEMISQAEGVKKLFLIQKRINLKAAIENRGKHVPTTELEDQFVAVAKTYSDNKAISRKAWRELGVSAKVLDRAGI